ncbi:hypothetical protein EA187_02395 [Lujinxingia sediminis]|uniref:MYXO-CTERM domain-containing protein n=1 Tax=Lujinxingia sediminis TaxID=2480984 RepID=A0ABY0CWP4_9DELT|nr:MYXO-CTERM sorting domain-containing protein [Lujinxingia sediminis]RVU48307.1 hypothetical protein EA187_02395 [Lujinxingia sediminis]
MTTLNLGTVLAFGAGVMLASAAWVEEAQACDPALEYVVDALPAEGAVVAPDAQLLIFFNGSDIDPTIELVDAVGEPVPVRVERTGQASFFGFVRELVPEEPLAEGSYRMRVIYSEAYQDDFERSFEVVADHVWAPVEGAPELTWYRETYAESTGNSCEWGDAYQMIRIGEVPGAISYDVELQRGDTVLKQRYLSDHVGMFQGFVLSNIDCVRVVALSGDGGPGETTELCAPDKCNHFEGEMPWDFGTTEWDDIEGCTIVPPVEGDPDDGDVGAGDAGEGDVGPGADVGGWDVGEPAGSPNDEGGGCSSTGGSPAGMMALALAMLGVVWRRRNAT